MRSCNRYCLETHLLKQGRYKNAEQKKRLFLELKVMVGSLLWAAELLGQLGGHKMSRDVPARNDWELGAAT